MSKLIPIKEKSTEHLFSRFAIVDDEDYERLSSFKWRHHRNGNTDYAYRRVQIDKVRRVYLMHREVMGCVHGDGVLVDHRDGNGLRNTKDNLRIADRSQNVWNSKLSRANTTGIKGVYWSAAKKKWKVWIMVRGVRTHLGSFADYDEAVTVRRKAEHESYGEFARLPDHVRKDLESCQTRK